MCAYEQPPRRPHSYAQNACACVRSRPSCLPRRLRTGGRVNPMPRGSWCGVAFLQRQIDVTAWISTHSRLRDEGQRLSTRSRPPCSLLCGHRPFTQTQTQDKHMSACSEALPGTRHDWNQPSQPESRTGRALPFFFFWAPQVDPCGLCSVSCCPLPTDET